jgi:hypothetical protein
VGRCYGQGLACLRGVWCRQTFNFSDMLLLINFFFLFAHMLLHLFGEFFIPCEEF